MTTILPVLAVLTLALDASGVRASEQAISDRASAPLDLLDFRIDGNTVLDGRVVERAVYPFLGPRRSIDDVEKARFALEQAFHDHGFQTVFVDVPEQEVLNGVVVLRVVEGRVERLKVSGSRYFSLGHIKQQVPALAENAVPHLPTVQNQLNALQQETADRKLTPVIRAGSTPGKLEVDLQVADRLPLHASVELNTRNSINTTRTRLTANLRYDNLWQRFHSASLQYLTSPENRDEVEVWSGTYAFPLEFVDARLALYGIGISSTSGVSAAGVLDVVGTGEIFGLRLSTPLLRDDASLHALTLGVDYKNLGQTLRVIGKDDLPTPIHYLPFLAELDNTWFGDAYRVDANLGLHFSVRGLGNDPHQFDVKRVDSSAGFFYVTAGIDHRHDLPAGLKLKTRFAGQFADSPLISNEQFSAGGPTSVRGYHQTELLGDHGVSGSLELQGPEFLPAPAIGLKLRGLVFADGAGIWIRKPLRGTTDASALASIGAGFRLELLDRLSGEFDWGYPVISTTAVRAGAHRLDFRLIYDL